MIPPSKSAGSFGRFARYLLRSGRWSRLGAMASILYSGQTLPLPEDVNVDDLAAVILHTYAQGATSWIALGLEGAEPNLRLLVGPGIPVAIISDTPTG